MSEPCYARNAGSRIVHLLVKGTKTTRCGVDAKFMARWAPSDDKVDRVIRPLCRKCTHPREES